MKKQTAIEIYEMMEQYRYCSDKEMKQILKNDIIIFLDGYLTAIIESDDETLEEFNSHFNCGENKKEIQCCTCSKLKHDMAGMNGACECHCHRQ